jgi:chromate transporter
VPFPIVVAAAALVEYVLGRWRPDIVPTPSARVPEGPEPLISDEMLHTANPSAWRTPTVLISGLLIWWLPVPAIALASGTGKHLYPHGAVGEANSRFPRDSHCNVGYAS